MDSDEIRARLTAAAPGGNIYWTDEDQAEQLLPAVKELMADVLLDAARDWNDFAQEPTSADWLPVVRWLRTCAEALNAGSSSDRRTV